MFHFYTGGVTHTRGVTREKEQATMHTLREALTGPVPLSSVSIEESSPMLIDSQEQHFAMHGEIVSIDDQSIHGDIVEVREDGQPRINPNAVG